MHTGRSRPSPHLLSLPSRMSPHKPWPVGCEDPCTRRVAAKQMIITVSLTSHGKVKLYTLVCSVSV